MARLFPELERSAREIGDLGTGFDPATGQMGFRQEADRTWAADGQSGTILRIYREHLMSVDDSFLRRVWPRTKLAIQFLINQDAADGHGADGVLEGRQHNTLDQDWYGEIPWLTGLYVAMLRAAVAMAGEVGDSAFAATCQALADRGSGYLNDSLWNGTYGYFEQKLDRAHLSATNSNRGCFIDQLFGQNYALQLGLPRVFDKTKTDTALANIYRNNFLPDPAAYARTKGIKGPRRIYNEDGEPGTIMCTWPYGGNDIAPGAGVPGLVGYFDEVWTGQEYQLAAHLIGEGMITQGLAVIRAIHDRYSASKRNPYNEIECSDHYSAR
ncbi:GH116 family glycosyl hydrolase [Fodinicola feengrottensis]|uniref:GH116 family glycosyl hydrolase n=1 Tax=Fodinicola feengrottensis TaxID=435914 RepID=UPI0013D51FF2|nr:GH116 family glycosyl hydrolase [Fodinicola feengrottensis]